MKHQSSDDKPIPTHLPPKNHHRRMVALISDIAESAQYFRVYGNDSGQNMLKRYEQIVARFVLLFGGKSITTTGDRMLSYFLDPKAAVKAGIGIQQHFLQHHGPGQVPKEQLQVKIGIHFGDGFVEKNAISGAVVELAARIVAIAAGNEIIISQTAYENIKHLQFDCEPLDLPQQKAMLKGLSLYKLKWLETAEFKSSSKVLVYLRPLFEIGPPQYAELWEVLHQNANDYAPHPIIKKHINADQSLAIIVETTAAAIETAEFIHARINQYIGLTGGYIPTPIQTFIDYGPFIRNEAIIFNQAPARDKNFEPGTIYLSTEAVALLDIDHPYPISPAVRDSVQTFWFPLVSARMQHQTLLFHYQGFLAAYSKGIPCFYCSSRKHPPLKCPSKRLEGTASSLKALMYRPHRELNRLYLDYLLKGDAFFADEAAPRQQNDDFLTHLAYEGFYQLKYIFQLRFIKALWDSEEEDWETAKTLKQEGKKGGGLLWLVYDCLRIGNLGKAESLLNSAEKEYIEDFRYYLLNAMLNIERHETTQALQLLHTALSRVKNTTQHIMVLFLIYRLHFIRDELTEAGKIIRLILSLNSKCREALLHNIILKYRTGRHKAVSLYVYKFVSDFPDYYLQLLIDPDLAPFNIEIQMELNRIFLKAKARAEQAMPEAEAEVSALQPLFGDETGELIEIDIVWQKIKNLQKADSYLGYLDILDYVNRVRQKQPIIISRRKSAICDKIREIAERCDLLLKRFSDLKINPQAAVNLSRLTEIKSRAAAFISELNAGEMDVFANAVTFTNQSYRQVSELRTELERLNRHRLSLLFMIKLLKSLLLLQGLNLAFNLMLPFLGEALLGWRLSSTQQTGALIGGAILAALAAIVFPLITVYPGASKD